MFLGTDYPLKNYPPDFTNYFCRNFWVHWTGLLSSLTKLID